MFTLTFERDPSAAAELRQALAGTRVQTWRDLSDAVCAYGYAGAGWWVMEWPRLGMFRFEPAKAEAVQAFPDPGVSNERIEDTCRRTVVPLLLQAIGHETLHASAVMGSRGVLAFCGERGAGKSTVAYGLGRRGFDQHADDTLVLTVAPNTVTTRPVPFVPRLRPASAEFFDDPNGRHASGAARTAPAAALAAIFILQPAEGSGAPAVRRLPPAQAFRAVAAHAHCFNPEDETTRRRLLQNYLEISACVPAFEVTYGPGLDGFDALLDALLSAAGETSGVPVTA